MSEHKKKGGNPDDLAMFEKMLPERSMFLVDLRPRKNNAIVYRCRDDGQIEKAYINRRQPHQWLEEYQYSIEGDYWGNMSGRLFDDVKGLTQALVKRGLTQVEF